MTLTQELKLIETTGKLAYDMAVNGDFRNARRALRKIERSYCVTESQRVISLVEAKILEGTGKTEEAKQKILDNMYYFWATMEGYEIISRSHPEIDSESEVYSIEILGGLATLGCFTQFTDKHIATFEVIANSLEEARAYIDEVANFEEPHRARILSVEKKSLESFEAWEGNRGVILSHPFRTMELREPFQELSSVQ